MRIIWSIIGVILQVIGNTFKRSDMLFLGYYLAGTGKPRSLPVYSHQDLVDMFISEYHTGAEFDWSIEIVRDNDVLHNTLGKFWCKYDKNYLYVKDEYIFYPICEDANTHFSDCTCKDKRYVNLHTHISLLPDVVLEFINAHNKVCHRIYNRLGEMKFSFKRDKVLVQLEYLMLYFTINDEFWVNKGKPFNVYCEIPV